MAIHSAQVAKRVLLSCRRLHELLEENKGTGSAGARVDTYNLLLEDLNEWFGKSDSAFVDAIAHLKPLSRAPETRAISRQMETDGQVLLTAAYRFVELYLAPEEKIKIRFDV